MPVKTLIAGKHSCIGHLSYSSTTGFDEELRLERPAMLVYCGKFNSMDGEVEIDEAIIDRLIRSHNEQLDSLLAKRNSEESDDAEVTRSMPPLQLDHSTSALHTVGRCIGKAFKAPFKNKDGVEVPALMIDKIRVLGKENMERVRDGRWCNLSIGADLELGILNEVSITPFPAAPNASLLKKMAAGVFDAQDCWEMFTGQASGFKALSTIRAGNGGKAQFGVESDATGFAMQLENYGPFKNVKSVKINGEMWVVTADFNLSFRGSSGENAKGAPMHEKLKKHLMEEHKLGEKEAEELSAKMHAHLKKLHGDDADKHLEEMEPANMSKLADDVKEEEKKLASEDAKKEEEKKEHLAAAKAAITKMSRDFKSTNLAAKKANLSAKLSGLRASAKITPAEIKKLDLDKLAASSDEVVEATLSAFEGRENVIDPIIHGTSKAVNLAKLAKEANALRLQAETKKDLGIKLSEKEEKALAEGGAAEHVEAAAPEGHDEYIEHLNKMMEGYDQRDAVMAEIKKVLKKRMEQYNPVGEVTEAKKMSALAENVTSLQNQFQELVALFGKVTGVKPADLTE